MNDFKGRHFRGGDRALGRALVLPVCGQLPRPRSDDDRAAASRSTTPRSIAGFGDTRPRSRNGCAGSGAGRSRDVSASTRPISRSVASERTLYRDRALDKLGNMIDFYLSAARNAKAAKRFLGKALRGSKEWEQSHRRQYDLVEVARRHGFARVEVIDDDLGLSATRTASETSLHPQSSNPPHITSGLQNKPPAPSALPCSSPCRPCSTPSCDRSRLAPHPAIPRESIEPRPAVVPRSAHEILPDPRLSPQDRTSRPSPSAASRPPGRACRAERTQTPASPQERRPSEYT